MSGSFSLPFSFAFLRIAGSIAATAAYSLAFALAKSEPVPPNSPLPWIDGSSGASRFIGRQALAPPFPSAECADFVNFATQRGSDTRYRSGENADLKPFNTDSLLVSRGGQIVYEWYDGLVTESTPHILWSASKALTATLLARTIKESAKAGGIRYQGRPIELDMPVALFYPAPALLEAQPQAKARYERMTLRHLVEMSANFDWKEYYDGDLATSSFFPMLYGTGIADTASFALRAPLHAEGPGGRWVYSGGNINILSGILAKIYGASYADMPWRLLFKPLGISDARVERDLSNQFIGSSYFYMSARSMEKIGQLYLRDAKGLLPAGWLEDARRVAPATGLVATNLATIKKLGTEGSRALWLNTPIHRADGEFPADATGERVLYPAEMPQAPADMYFAAGHYGQLIIVIPSQSLVIARTGYDEAYWDHIQPLAVKALACVNPSFRPDFSSAISLTPPSAGAKASFLQKLFDDIVGLPGKLANMRWIQNQGLVEKIVAKELCSFLFVSGSYDAIRARAFAQAEIQRARPPTGAEIADAAQAAYFERSGVPSWLRTILMVDDTVTIDDENRLVTVARVRRGTTPAAFAEAREEPETTEKPRYGCQLTRY